MQQRRRLRAWEEPSRAVDNQYVLDRRTASGMWPLYAPGMPPPGPDFVAAAELELALQGFDITPERVDRKLEAIYGRALRMPGFSLPVRIRGGESIGCEIVPGHRWGDCVIGDSPTRIVTTAYGPTPSSVMLIGKMPWVEEAQQQRHFVGESARLLLDCVRNVDIDVRSWYVTSVLKFKPPGDEKKITASWLRDCMPLLAAELRIVRPRVVLCLGADAIKAVLGTDQNVSTMMARHVPLVLDFRADAGERPREHEMFVYGVNSPADVLRDRGRLTIFRQSFGRFVRGVTLTSAGLIPAIDELPTYGVVDTDEKLDLLVHIITEHFRDVPKANRLLAWDCEWQGRNPFVRGSYLRTIQVAWDKGLAATIVVHEAGGRPGVISRRKLVERLNELAAMARPVGHFINADIEWLHYYGIDLVSPNEIPVEYEGDVPPWEAFRGGRGFLDTAFMLHAIEETAMLGLEHLLARFTTMPRYDLTLQEWLKDEAKRRGHSVNDFDGFGDVPNELLYRYGPADADATLRICRELLPLIDRDADGNSLWVPLWESLAVLPVFADMRRNGIRVDRDRMTHLTHAFEAARAAMEERVRSDAGWPEFNLRSVQQVKEYLFGEKYNGALDDAGEVKRLRPPGARSLALTPLVNTAKPPRQWADIAAAGEERRHAPSTSKTTLAIVANESDPQTRSRIHALRDYRYLDQALKTVLCPAVRTEEGAYFINDDGEVEYDRGLPAYIDSDGRIRPNLQPRTETGRASCKPNLQNISKRRDADYQRILGDAYDHKMRSILIPSEGFVFVDFDITGAELLGMALMSGDDIMIEDCRRSLLKDEGYDETGKEVRGGKFPHPDYYDIHSNIAVLAFSLTVPAGPIASKKILDKYGLPPGTTYAEALRAPAGSKLPATKKALAIVEKSHYRVLAKNVIFGVAYGRGAKAIAFQVREEGMQISIDEAQKIIDTIFDKYRGLPRLFEACRARVSDPGWLRHCFGRYRRFPKAVDRTTLAEYERQAMNFPIQGMVASGMNRALPTIRKIIIDNGLQDDLRMLLQVHDACLSEMRPHLVDWYATHVVPHAVIAALPLFPTDLTGKPTGKGPYSFGIDITVESRWGETIDEDEAANVAIPSKYAT